MKKATKFQRKVWDYIALIPKGKTMTYKEVAIGIKKPKSARAVANACARNPYPIIIPCHRIIKSNGNIGGYSAKGGVKRKIKLLLKEGAKISLTKKL